jgi:hypothetical protein
MNQIQLKDYLFGAREELGKKVLDKPERWFFPVASLPDEAKPLLNPERTGVFIIERPDGKWDISI